MTQSSRNVRHAVRFALAASATVATGPLAYAQTAPASAAAPIQEVVVTGSRILQAPNDISISPVTTVSSLEIQQTGLIRVEDILAGLPQVSAEQSSGNSIASLGTATVSLRGLGSQRTLVLIDGRRMQPGGAGGVVGPGGSANSPDINQIPADLIQRVDVLTGGASAVYGADAVAGVVNFVLDSHYQGVKVSGNYAFNNHGNNDDTYKGYLSSFGAPLPQSTVNTGQNLDFAIIAGSNFADGKGNATVYTTYLKSQPAVGYQFDHAGCTLVGGATGTDPIQCGGSGTSAHGQFLQIGLVGASATTIVDNAVDPNTGAFRPYSNAVDSYNYGALSFFQRDAERWTAGAFLHYDLTDHMTFYSETMFARNTSQAQYGPSGAFFDLVTSSCANPLLTTQEHSTFCNPTTLAQNQALYGLSGDRFSFYLGRRSVESGGRQDNYTSDSFRQVIGTKGDLGEVWTYDAYGSVGITDFSDRLGNNLNSQNVVKSIDVVGTAANPVCASGGSCVPWNVWVPGGVTQDALNYLVGPATYASNSTEYIMSGSVTGDMGKYGVRLPTANSGLALNIGTEYREEKFNFAPDYVFANGFQDGGAPSKAIDGKFHVWEGFAEARMPILTEMPLAYNLSAEAGYRYSSYTLGFNTNTYKFGLEWAPIQDVRLRGTYNRAVRAPNINELYQPATVGAGGTADPCWGPINPATGLVGSGATAAECANSGVTAAQYGHITVNPAAQINTQAGGNSTLQPETADTYTYGFVFQPTFLPNFVASVDYYRITIKDTITSLSSNTIISNCEQSGDASLCGLIHRGPTGSLWLSTQNYVQATTLNIGTVSTSGVDLSSHYQFNAGSFGKVGLNLIGTYTRYFDTQPLPNGASYDCVGYWGSTCGAPIPTWRQVFSANWLTPWAGLDLTLRWRYIGPSNVDRQSSDPGMHSADFYRATSHINAYNYLDFSAVIPFKDNFNFRVGVNNIADKNPPLILNGSLSDCPNSTCNDNTWVGTYDTLGRYIYFHAEAKF